MKSGKFAVWIFAWTVFCILSYVFVSNSYAGKPGIPSNPLESRIANLEATVSVLQNTITDLQNQINNQQLAILGLEQIRVGYNENRAGMLPVPLASTYKNIISVTLNAPSNGYVVVTGNGYTGITHVYGKADTVRVSLPNWTDGFHSAAFTTVSVPGSAPSGGYEFPFSLTASFNVTAGSNTFYMTGVTDGNAFVTLPYITAIFIPEKF